MHLMELQSKYKLFVDMDGVVADFVAGVETAVREYKDDPTFKYEDAKYDADSKYRSLTWKSVGEYQKKHGNKFWYDLPLLPDAMTLWNYVKKHDPSMLTAYGNPHYEAQQQKRDWIKEKFGPQVNVILTRKAVEKAGYAKENYVLIDDKLKAIDPWVAAGGIGILHTSAAKTIAKLKELGL